MIKRYVLRKWYYLKLTEACHTNAKRINKTGFIYQEVITSTFLIITVAITGEAIFTVAFYHVVCFFAFCFFLSRSDNPLSLREHYLITTYHGVTTKLSFYVVSYLSFYH